MEYFIANWGKLGQTSAHIYEGFQKWTAISFQWKIMNILK